VFDHHRLQIIPKYFLFFILVLFRKTLPQTFDLWSIIFRFFVVLCKPNSAQEKKMKKTFERTENKYEKKSSKTNLEKNLRFFHRQVRLLKVNFCLSGYVFNDQLAVGFVRELVGGEEGEGERLPGELMVVKVRDEVTLSVTLLSSY
jgi:hypothetical protein